MRKELEKRLIKKYPALYLEQSKNKNLRIECDDGWYMIVETVSKLLNENKSYVGRVRFIKHSGFLKPDFAMLTSKADYLFGIANMAFLVSQVVCEQCGARGTELSNYRGTACELHGGENDITSDFLVLPCQMEYFGGMWSVLISNLHLLIVGHQEENLMPKVKITKIFKKNGRLKIEYTGGNEVTRGMVRFIEEYASNINEETGCFNFDSDC